MKTFDYSKIKDFKWDTEILSLVAQIHEAKGRQELFLERKPNVLGKLVEIAKIQSVEDSNRIEGIVTTTSRMKDLLKEKTTPRNRDEEEILGYRDVLNTIHESYEYIPLRSSYILQLHSDLYKYSGKSIGGRYKNTQNIIAETLNDGSQVVRFTPLDPYETPDAVVSICENFNKALDDGEVDSLLLIPIFIHDFLCIHPFNEPNNILGRYQAKKYKSIVERGTSSSIRSIKVAATVFLSSRLAVLSSSTVKAFIKLLLNSFSSIFIVSLSSSNFDNKAIFLS